MYTDLDRNLVESISRKVGAIRRARSERTSLLLYMPRPQESPMTALVLWEASRLDQPAAVHLRELAHGLVRGPGKMS